MKTKHQKRIEAVERAIIFYRSCSIHGHPEISKSAKNGVENTIKKLNPMEREDLGKEFNSLNLKVE